MQEALLQQPTIKLGRIKLGRNPRTYFDDAKMAEMKASITARGVDTPVIVRPIDDGFYELIAGGRRFKAALETRGEDYDMPVNVKDVDEVEAEEIAFTENIQRDDMSPGDEAVEAARLLGRCQGDRDEAARRIGWSRPTLDSRLALLNCSKDVLIALNPVARYCVFQPIDSAFSLRLSVPLFRRRRGCGVRQVAAEGQRTVALDRHRA